MNIRTSVRGKKVFDLYYRDLQKKPPQVVAPPKPVVVATKRTSSSSSPPPLPPTFLWQILHPYRLFGAQGRDPLGWVFQRNMILSTDCQFSPKGFPLPLTAGRGHAPSQPVRFPWDVDASVFLSRTLILVDYFNLFTDLFVFLGNESSVDDAARLAIHRNHSFHDKITFLYTHAQAIVRLVVSACFESRVHEPLVFLVTQSNENCTSLTPIRPDASLTKEFPGIQAFILACPCIDLTLQDHTHKTKSSSVSRRWPPHLGQRLMALPPRPIMDHPKSHFRLCHTVYNKNEMDDFHILLILALRQWYQEHPPSQDKQHVARAFLVSNDHYRWANPSILGQDRLYRIDSRALRTMTHQGSAAVN